MNIRIIITLTRLTSYKSEFLLRKINESIHNNINAITLGRLMNSQKGDRNRMAKRGQQIEKNRGLFNRNNQITIHSTTLELQI